MIAASLLVALTGAPTTLPTLPPQPAAPVVVREEVDDKIKAAGDDVEALLALAQEYRTAKDRASAKKVFLRVIEIDVDNKDARKALRHQRYDGKWFTSYVELSKYKREEAARKKEQGLAKFKDQWVPAADVPFLSMGWEKGENGWVNPFEVAIQKEIAKLEAQGYQFRPDDNTYVGPDELDHWREQRFKCGEEWLDLEKANAFHSKIETAWQIAGDHFLVLTTTDWQTGSWSRWHAESTYPSLVRLFGVEPEDRQLVAVMKSLEEYNQTIFVESEGFSSLHGAYFADSFFQPGTNPRQFRGCGVTYWDKNNDKVAVWGPFWIRWAAAQSYVDAIDRSWGAIGSQAGNQQDTDPGAYGAAFWREKKVPRWMRYGASSYVERFMPDPTVTEGGDPMGVRNFAFSELKKAGGLHDLKDVFAFQLSLEDIPSSQRLMQGAGLVVCYLLDGAEGDEKLAALHKGFQEALASNDAEKTREAAKLLEAELTRHEDKIKAFAGL
ncbi:MAG: hypothetical protein AAGB93_13840 [Planctomycetota bacterium]